MVWCTVSTVGRIPLGVWAHEDSRPQRAQPTSSFGAYLTFEASLRITLAT